MRTNTVFRRLVAGAVVLATASAGLLIGGGAAGAQLPQPDPSGPITFSPAVGDQQTIFSGVTSGPCDLAGPDATNAVVAGPGVFAPGSAEGIPDGRTWTPTTDLPNTTDPISFQNRLQLVDLAQEAGGPILPGEYVVTLRCVDGLFGTIYQTYRSSLTVADAGGGNFTITANNPPGGPTPTPTASSTPTPTGSVSPTPSATPTPTGSATPSPSGTPGPTVSVTPTPTGTATPIPSESVTPSPTPTESVTPSPSPNQPRDTSTQLIAFPNPAEADGPVILLAKVSPYNARGRVQFKADEENIGRAQRIFCFGFALQFAEFDEGQYDLTAEFVPRNPRRYSPSTSEVVSLQVDG